MGRVRGDWRVLLGPEGFGASLGWAGLAQRLAQGQGQGDGLLVGYSGTAW